MIAEKLFTTYGKLLIAMYDNQMMVNGKHVMPLTQVELAEMLNTNKTTINLLFKEYKADKLLEKDKGRYYLTDVAVEVVKKLKSVKW